jgi:hypothetical protein
MSAISEFMERVSLEIMVRVAFSLAVDDVPAKVFPPPQSQDLLRNPYPVRNLTGFPKRLNLSPGEPSMAANHSGPNIGESDEFLKLPPQIRKQLLHYGNRWVEAMFEPVTEERHKS